jgi:hypothetical protein
MEHLLPNIPFFTTERAGGIMTKDPGKKEFAGDLRFKKKPLRGAKWENPGMRSHAAQSMQRSTMETRR